MANCIKTELLSAVNNSFLRLFDELRGNVVDNIPNNAVMSLNITGAITFENINSGIKNTSATTGTVNIPISGVNGDVFRLYPKGVINSIVVPQYLSVSTTEFMGIPLATYVKTSYGAFVGDIKYCGYLRNCTTLAIGRFTDKLFGTVESIVETMIDNYPDKEKTLSFEIYYGAQTVKFHNVVTGDGANDVYYYIKFYGDGTAAIYDNPSLSGTPLASYNGTIWSYA